MQLSVIIVNFNTFDYTCKCISSIRESIDQLDYEVIMVDNASTECSPDRVKALFPFIRLLSLERNLGFAGGVNSGLELAQGEVILLLNSDTEILDRAINVAYDYLVGHNNVGVVGAKLIYPNGEIQGCCQRFPSFMTEFLELTRLQKLLGKKRDRIMLGAYFDHKREMETDWIWGTFFMVKKSAIDKFPGKVLPDDFFMYGEDREWCYLIKSFGYKIMYYPEAVVIHHVGASSAGESGIEKTQVMRDHEFSFLQRHYGPVSARLIFMLRSLNYLTLFTSDRKFLSLASQYFKRAISK